MSVLGVLVPPQRRTTARLARFSRFGLILAVVVAFLFFTVLAPGFVQPSNLRGILVNNFALLAIAAIATTLAVHSGGIDLSVATAIDLASLAFVSAIVLGADVPLAVLAALAAAACSGLFNALLIAGLGIPPFLATLGTLFIGHSVQQLATGGGNPVYISFKSVPPALPVLARGSVFGVPIPVLAVLALSLLVYLLLERMRFGRRSAAIGVEPQLALYSGLPVRATLATVYVLSAVIAGAAGVFLSANVSAYMPFSGNAFLMNAIGAVYIGTTVSRARTPSVPGTLVGVLFLAIIANGLLLIGWDFYWQQLGSGIAIFLCLALSYGVQRLRS